MKIVQIEHDDFIFSIQTNGIRMTFEKARRKQTGIETATHYQTSDGSLQIFDYSENCLKEYKPGKTHPLFFENKDYFLNISFRNKDQIKSPLIKSNIREIGEKFFYLEETGLKASPI